MANQNPTSSRMVDWFLYNLPMLKEQVETMEGSTTCKITIVWARTQNTESKIEKYAIKRNTVLSAVSAVEKGIRSLHPDQRKVYRLKYKQGFSNKAIRKRLYFSTRTVERRLAEVRNMISMIIANALHYRQGLDRSRAMKTAWAMLKQGRFTARLPV
ncbi:MAG: hypothetical protein A4E52_00442 [Pelotomaculum sp. PtaB.Bin013]|uniref:ECF-type sigma factor n=1 Tax=Pelotomaculum isophthalicicum JI TaxID=947010 RepID=A0A9X4JVG3_9FIRM|nr:ECF-type sigma factor [Pelotomaculum isophthalicicum]MDF9408276.1 ECF-type sigma factor [Pelotomaculum isophthalicicum JI]OPX91623.1 MAG: hypothetical protein A4E52_00442 [Pelotomaculum sp. PtaB.Bin013]